MSLRGESFSEEPDHHGRARFVWLLACNEICKAVVWGVRRLAGAAEFGILLQNSAAQGISWNRLRLARDRLALSVRLSGS